MDTYGQKETNPKLFSSRRGLYRFITLTLCAQFAFSVLAMKGVLLPQMLSMWDISKTQFGILMSVYGITHNFLYVALSWVQDRYSSRVLIPINMVMGGITTFFLGVASEFKTLCFLFFMLAIWCEGAFWPAILAAVRRSTSNTNQSKIFGLLEGGRGCVELLQNTITLGLYAILSYSVLGLELAFKVNALIMIILGVISWFVLPDQVLLKSAKKRDRNKEVAEGIKLSMGIPSVWLAGCVGFFIYVIYTSLPFYITYITDLFLVPAVGVSLFGILSTSGGRIGAALPAGFVADRFFHGAPGAMKYGLIVVCFLCLAISFISASEFLWWLPMIVLTPLIVIIFFMRALYFAPYGEMGIPPRFSGAVIAFAAFLIYLPSSFAYLGWGYLLDMYPGSAGYRGLFMILAITAGVGAYFASKLEINISSGASKEIALGVKALDSKLQLQGHERSFDSQ